MPILSIATPTCPRAARALARAIVFAGVNATTLLAALPALSSPTSQAQAVTPDITRAETLALAQILGVMEQTRAIQGSQVDLAEAGVRDGFWAPGPDGAPRPRSLGAWRLYGGPDVEDDHRPATSGADRALDARSWGGSIGADTLLTHKFLVGVRIDQDHLNGKFGSDTGSYAADMTQVTMLTTYRISGMLSLRSSTSFGFIDYNRLERRAGLESMSGSVVHERATGSTHGAYQSSRTSLDYERPIGAWMVAASARLSYERNLIDAYSETPSLLALSYGHSAITDYRAGVDFRAERRQPFWGLRPYFEIAYDHDLTGGGYALNAGPDPSLIVADSTPRPYDSAASLTAGVTRALGRGLELGATFTGRGEFGSRTEALGGAEVFVSPWF
jgi:uncharacterized protein YhjY with autotransporter beta-barrel domain